MDHSALRDQNRKTVEAFLELRGPDRGPRRAAMFTPDSKVEMFLRDGAHLDMNGRDWCLATPDTFPIWGFYEARIYETPGDPNSFLVPAVGRGQIFAPGGKGPGHDVEIWYILLFELKDGMITRFRETVDYCRGGDVITDRYTPDRPDLFVRHDNPFDKANRDLISQAHAARRAENIACIRQYVDARTLEQRSRRWELYVDDCTSGAVAGEPLKGKEIARHCTEWNLVYFPNYVFNDNIIFQSTDPDYYCVMSKGTGGINYPAYGAERQYDNVYFHVIRMRGGRMKDYFEYSNLLGMYKTLGIPIPALQSPAGWPEHTPEEAAHDPYPRPQYSDPAHPDVIPAGDEALRAKNIACIRQYVDARTVEERGRRWDLYVDGDDCSSGAAGMPALFGKAKARQCTEWNLDYFPDYVFNNNVIFQTQDPNLFLVMSDGTGGIHYPAYGERKTYENVYFHTFHMQDGKIRHYYEYSNAKLLFDVLGVELPAIQTPAGWPGVV